jgi:DNA-binding PadR family transcriptional regulator
VYGESVTLTFRRSPLALAILGLLENGPMHPYGIQRLIKRWGKDKVVNVDQRASLYRMIDRLLEAGLITAGETDRDERYPERTTYHLTDGGRAATQQWLTEIVSTPRNEFPEFPAALSFLMLETPKAAQTMLEQRRDQLIKRVAELDAELAMEIEGLEIPRIAMVEIEYLRAITDAELRWVGSILDELRDGSFTWDREELLRQAAAARE